MACEKDVPEGAWRVRRSEGAYVFALVAVEAQQLQFTVILQGALQFPQLPVHSGHQRSSQPAGGGRGG